MKPCRRRLPYMTLRNFSTQGTMPDPAEAAAGPEASLELCKLVGRKRRVENNIGKEVEDRSEFSINPMS